MKPVFEPETMEIIMKRTCETESSNATSKVSEKAAANTTSKESESAPAKVTKKSESPPAKAPKESESEESSDDLALADAHTFLQARKRSRKKTMKRHPDEIVPKAVPTEGMIDLGGDDALVDDS